MHTLLGLTSVLLVVLASYLALWALPRLHGWTHRRDLQLLVLAAPLMSLAIAIGGLHHFAGRTCFVGAPPWDYAVGIALPLAMGGVAAGAVLLGLARLALMNRLVAHTSAPAGADVTALVEDVARRCAIAPPRVHICVADRPVALTAGLRRPTLLLSTWMVQHLDRRELEAVVAHELGHVARRDYPAVWLAMVLRDAFCYLPTSWAAYQQLQEEKELACDELAVAVTRRPLALASALARVWHRSVGGPSLQPAQLLVGAGASIEARIGRLLSEPAQTPAHARSRGLALGVGASAVTALLILQALNLAVMLSPMGCGITPMGLLL